MVVLLSLTTTTVVCVLVVVLVVLGLAVEPCPPITAMQLCAMKALKTRAARVGIMLRVFISVHVLKSLTGAKIKRGEGRRGERSRKIYFCMDMKRVVAVLVVGLLWLGRCPAQDPLPVALESEDEPLVELGDSGASWVDRLCIRLDNILCGQIMERSQVAVVVYDLTADSLLYAINEEQSLRPASVEKVLTAVTALSVLGAGYELCTSLSYTGSVSEGVLWGDLWLRGEMDPMFDTADLRVFADSLRRLGIDSIAGQLIFDRSMKDTIPMGEGWSWDDFDSNPPLTPLLYCGRAGLEQAVSRALGEAGVAGPSIWMEGRVPAGATPICERRHTLSQLLIDMMKKSDNLHAEAMFYQLGRSSGQSTAERSAARVEQFVLGLGFDRAMFNVADGCGLSLYNYTTASIVVAVLRAAYHDPKICNTLRLSLPIAGLDGTLAKRLHNTSAFGNVRAKTGTVSRVSTLAGYATSGEGHEVAFCIINQGQRSASSARSLQDKVCIAICDE